MTASLGLVEARHLVARRGWRARRRGWRTDPREAGRPEGLPTRPAIGHARVHPDESATAGVRLLWYCHVRSPDPAAVGAAAGAIIATGPAGKIRFRGNGPQSSTRGPLMCIHAALNSNRGPFWSIHGAPRSKGESLCSIYGPSEVQRCIFLLLSRSSEAQGSTFLPHWWSSEGPAVDLFAPLPQL